MKVRRGRVWPPVRLPCSQGRLPHPSSRTAHTVFHSTSALHRTLFGALPVLRPGCQLRLHFAYVHRYSPLGDFGDVAGRSSRSAAYLRRGPASNWLRLLQRLRPSAGVGGRSGDLPQRKFPDLVVHLFSSNVGAASPFVPCTVSPTAILRDPFKQGAGPMSLNT